MLAMDQGVVEEWLSEFKTFPETAISSYAASLKEKGSLVPALYKVIRENYSDLLEPVCHQLFEFYRSGEARLQRFTLQFLPELVWSYLSASSGRNPHHSGCIEALLLGIYNLEIVDKDGQSKVLSFTVPSLSKPSVYHEPSAIGSMALTEGALANRGLSRIVYSGPHLQRETFTAQNRVCICGYPRQQVRRYKGNNSRMMVTSEFLVQLITGIHFALCNGEPDLGSKALDDVLYRAQLELFPEVLLVGNAIKSSLRGAALKSNKEGTRSIQVEITPTSSRISRNAVTSLSIRGHRWKRHESQENSLDSPDSTPLSPIPTISVTGVSGERVANGEALHGRTEAETLGGTAELGLDPKDAVDLTSPEELMEISEVDEGICTQAAAKEGSPPIIVVSSTNVTPNIGKAAGKGLRRLTGSKSSKDKEKEGEVLRKQSCSRAMSENLELLSLKRLTLTSSQSVPKGGALSLSRTASAAFSRSFEHVSNALGVTNRASSPAPNHSPKENRHSACSLQEEAYIEHLSPANIRVQLSPDM
ncbi:Hyccin [Bagarius yarrelli]|uniref:Hyccin n=1 Tax=Bagarius yarrelli TaxID=175774 RepID=A0A556UF18_BAGYA|nr:Hyccin [Bagarius yarrelli]